MGQCHERFAQCQITNDLLGVIAEEPLVLANLYFFSRMDDDVQEHTYEVFAMANTNLGRHAAALPWYEKLIDLLGSPEVQRFRSQGKHVCHMGSNLMELGDFKASRTKFLKARKIAEAHGFFQVRSRLFADLKQHSPNPTRSTPTRVVL